MPSDPPAVATIILNWRDSAATLAAVAAVAAQDYPAQRIYVFDNGATAETRAALAPLEGRAVLLSSPVNLGYTGGNNAAMRQALADGADYLWLFNSDATAGPEVLSALVAVAEADPRAGLVSPVVRSGAEEIEFAAAYVDAAACMVDTAVEPVLARRWLADRPERIVVVGTAMLVPRRLTDAIGLLDDRLFAYAEDMDYSLRALAAGFRNRVAVDVSVQHAPKPPVRAPHGYYLMNRNAILLWRRHRGRAGWAKAVLAVAHRVLRDIGGRLRPHPDHAQAALAGLWDGALGVTGPYDASRRMPRPLAALLTARPGWAMRVLDWF